MDIKPKVIHRGPDLHWTKSMKDQMLREDKLRLKYFRANEQAMLSKLDAPSLSPLIHAQLEQVKDARRQFFQGADRYPKPVAEEPVPPHFDPAALTHTMRPIDPEVEQLIYNSNNHGRVFYLKERVKVLPENRYYFPETTSFEYGWNMWETCRNAVDVRYGKTAIVRKSFYRRRGADRDPDWYRAPARLSPTVCSNS